MCRQETGASSKVRLSKAEAAAAQKREQMAAAAEARMARLQLLSQQQQLWWRTCCSSMPESVQILWIGFSITAILSA